MILPRITFPLFLRIRVNKNLHTKGFLNKIFFFGSFCVTRKKLALSKVSKNIKIDNTKTDIISIFMMRFIKRGSQTDLDFICHRDMMMVSEHQPPFGGSIHCKCTLRVHSGLFNLCYCDIWI